MISVQLKNLNIPFIRFSAIDGADKGAAIASVNPHRFIASQKRYCTRAELACAASHIAVWKAFLKSDAEYALILEDDVEIDQTLTEILRNFERFRKYDFLNLSSNEPFRLDQDQLQKTLEGRQEVERPSLLHYKKRKQWKKLEWRRRWRIFALNPILQIGIVCECDPAPALGSGYIVSRKAAQNFIGAAQNISFPIDLVWRHSSGRLRQAFLARPIIKQTNRDTDISGRFNQDRVHFGYRLLRPFLKNRRWRRRWDVVRLYGLLKQ